MYIFIFQKKDCCFLSLDKDRTVFILTCAVQEFTECLSDEPNRTSGVNGTFTKFKTF